MSPSILTAFPARFSSSALSGSTSRAHDSLRLAFPTTSSEAHLQTPAIPTHASIYLEREWAIPAGCDFPGASFFSSQFANLKSFPVRSLLSRPSYRNSTVLTHSLCMPRLDLVVFCTLGRQCGRLHLARYLIGDRNLTFNPPFSHFCLDYSILCPPQHERDHRNRRQHWCRRDTTCDRAGILCHATSSSSSCPVRVLLRERRRESHTRSVGVLGS